MEIRVDHVSVSDSDEGCQVDFGGEGGEELPYLLLQRHFEDPGGGLLYLETHDPNYAGRVTVRRATLGRDRFRLELLRQEAAGLEVTFKATAQQYGDVARVLRILIPGLKVDELPAG